ncbi:MAG: hypothetical protein KGL34_01305, partial [Gammaproteobacteria bacterium]|nr:hypothetical protein [Gammaproteobacteria bacterium]
MAWFWFIAGMISALAVVVVLLPWLANQPLLRALAHRSWVVAAGAIVVAAATLLSSHWIPAEGGANGTLPVAAGSFAQAVKVFDQSTATPAAGMGGMGSASAPTAAQQAAAGSMDSAIVNLEARLAKGGGAASDWELLARAFEFEGRPDDAAKARAHQLPPWPPSGAGPAGPAAAPATTVVSGEITISAKLAARAKSGETLFVFATSAAAPGPPVAVYRTSVGSWPLHFRLDDSQSM